MSTGRAEGDGRRAQTGACAGSPGAPASVKAVVLAPASVVHTQRWIEGLAARGLQLVLATQHPADGWQPPAGVRVVPLPRRGRPGYFLNVPALRRLLRAERPDLLHVHYASGYGTTAALAGWRPWLLSVWGSDVYDFPAHGALAGWWLRRNLRRADAIASTSHAMAAQVRRLVPTVGAVAVTPFGIDTVRFAPRDGLSSAADAPAAAGPVAASGGGLVIGTVKTLAPKYGIDVLLRAFAQLLAGDGDAAPSVPLSLLIVGDGPQRAALEALAAQLGLGPQVRFVGAVAHADVPGWLRRMDVFVAASRLDSESFGVAVLEASACGLPVVVSDAGGLPEVVQHGRTGLVVPRDDVAALAGALRALAASPALRRELGRAGRAHVQQRYEWRAAVDAMLACFAGVAARQAAHAATA